VILGAATPATAAPESPATVAGTGSPGATGDGGPAAQSTLNAPLGAAAGADGTLYIADTGNRKVRAVAPDGTISTVAGSGEAATRAPAVAAGAKATDVALLAPAAVAVGGDGTVFIADAGAIRVYALAKDGTLTVRADAAGTASLTRPMGAPTGLAAGSDGTVYVGDQENNRVLAVSPDGRPSVAAGNGVVTASAAGGPATEVPVGAPNSLAASGDGDVWISGGLLLRRLRAQQIATVTAPGPGTWATADGAQWPPADQPLNDVEAVGAGADGPYVFDRKQKAVLRLGAGGAVTTVASLTEARGLIHLAVGPAADGPVYIVDTGGHRVLSVRVTADPGTPPGGTDEAPLWPWLVGGAVLVLLIVLLIVVVARRRA
jgi:sugar lactone lactonase YvrE